MFQQQYIQIPVHTAAIEQVLGERLQNRIRYLQRRRLRMISRRVRRLHKK